jgi:hypothetical protein
MLNLFAHADDALTSINVPDVSINWWAILAATAVAMVIGSLWFGPIFGKQWMKIVGLKKKDTQDAWKVPMVTMLVMAFVQAYILRHFIVYAAYFYPDMSELSVGIIVAFWAWVGLILPLVISSNMFARRPMDLTKIEAGNQLVTLLAIGAILAVWN